MLRYADAALPFRVGAAMLFLCLVPVTAAVLNTAVKLNTGAQMPALAYGTYRLEGEQLKSSLLTAIAAGYRHVDTSAGYENEHIVAEAIEESGIPREEFYLTTKLWCTDHGDEDTVDAIIQSLGALNTDYIDCYLVHAPANLGESDEETVELRRQSWSVMEQFHGAGALRAIGVSNFEPKHIEQLLQSGTVTPAVNQVECHAYLGQRELREYCARKGIVVASYGSIGANGLLDDPTVQRIANDRGKSAAQVSLCHSLQRSGCGVALARSVTPERIVANLEALAFELTADEIGELDALERGERSYWDNTQVP